MPHGIISRRHTGEISPLRYIKTNGGWTVNKTVIFTNTHTYLHMYNWVCVRVRAITAHRHTDGEMLSSNSSAVAANSNLCPLHLHNDADGQCARRQRLPRITDLKGNRKKEIFKFKAKRKQSKTQQQKQPFNGTTTKAVAIVCMCICLYVCM